MNLQLLEHIDKVEEANRHLDRFAFVASHDLQGTFTKDPALLWTAER
jgi:light-regulated signal transduction histidine kinase (bacteriophytochrome)